MPRVDHLTYTFFFQSKNQQNRMRNASILVAGMRALSNEVCKNIVLAGVGSITILEHEKITEQDLGAQFFLRETDLGRNVKQSPFQVHVAG